MPAAACILLHLMTLDTKGPVSVMGQHKICACGMHAVARYARNYLIITRIYDISSNRMGC